MLLQYCPDCVLNYYNYYYYYYDDDDDGDDDDDDAIWKVHFFFESTNFRIFDFIHVHYYLLKVTVSIISLQDERGVGGSGYIETTTFCKWRP